VKRRISSSVAWNVQLFPIIDVTDTLPSESIAYDPAPRPAKPPLEVTATVHGSTGLVREAAHDNINNIVATIESFITVSML
jgi:hypothetical protein